MGVNLAGPRGRSSARAAALRLRPASVPTRLASRNLARGRRTPCPTRSPRPVEQRTHASEEEGRMRTGGVLLRLAVAGLLVGCGGGGGDGGGTTGPKPVASVVLSPSAAQSMIVTRTLQVSATPRDDAGA